MCMYVYYFQTIIRVVASVMHKYNVCYIHCKLLVQSCMYFVCISMFIVLKYMWVIHTCKVDMFVFFKNKMLDSSKGNKCACKD